MLVCGARRVRAGYQRPIFETDGCHKRNECCTDAELRNVMEQQSVANALANALADR